MPFFKDIKDNIMARAQQALQARKAMSTTRKKMKRGAAKMRGKGPAGESRNVRLDKKSPIGKLQARNRSVKNQLDQLD